ncbi:chromosome segregation protein SMC [Coralloluteibacterium stylophorae]|uniref:Chromosome partition protein Smc n=1 Tax=Coralloluteibacterium stylophorae TaxID=1776034 RepID=A0A8J8AYT2_9GAMM|nr:chromosome segregation protein SMC [Coralloluteibacterium stylophorae]MBS7457532.1 chromosome segregation protein SMC [Coralloluteibacterium stylophorae]
MRLSTVKLAGFKSFVDPTTLHLPTNMTGIVGPNGCGKSNIIDAVRWVMGESSASRLRGDSLTDVIFSGSSGRKPVSQATVELIFDNSDGTVVGEYASYNEISVKRLVSRDGTSSYYLNGSRCRRRDITDLFLGTGLGPRSYSIIEQGMISQVIDAKPEELRVHLEEAAGISKYKERRRETETRIRHTRENMERLNDLREEVGKQIEHLRRQARAAEQYQALQAERKARDVQLKALEFRSIDAELAAQREALGGEETRLEKFVSEQRHAEAQIEACREQLAEANERLQGAQSENYRVGAEIARIEQQITHQRELTERLRGNRAEAEAALVELDRHIEDDTRERDALQAALDADTPRLEALREEDEARQDALRETESALGAWQARWDAYATAHSEAARAAEVERTRIEYLERQGLDAQRRRETLAAERGGLDVATLDDDLVRLTEEHEHQRASLDGLAAQLDERRAALDELQVQQRQKQGELAEARKRTQSARGRLASLEALQHAALGQEKGAAQRWLAERGLDAAPRLGERLRVASGWETAVETVLGSLIEAVGVDAPDTHLDALAGVRDARIALFDPEEGQLEVPAESLAAQVEGPRGIRAMLARVMVAEDAAAARARLASLGAGEAVVTRGGEWLGGGWARVLRADAGQGGALVREREIQALREEIEGLGESEVRLDAEISALRERMLEAEQQREDAQRTVYTAQRSGSELAGRLQSLRGKLESAQGRAQRIEAELDQLGQAAEQGQAQVREARQRAETALSRMGDLEAERQQLDAQRRELNDRRESARGIAREARETAHRLALQIESQRAKLGTVEQALARAHAQREQAARRRDELDAQLAGGDAPVERLQQERQVVLDQRVIAEKDLSAARGAVDAVQGELRQYEAVRQQRDAQSLGVREALAKRRLEEQALVLRAEQLRADVRELEVDLDSAIAGLPEDADAERWRREVGDLEQRMRRLEPVNLAAISEYGEQSQRKDYLDAQHVDLASALETLEGAIRKIDRETRGRFKETFDRVNAGVQDLFPRLFGGGHAYLELTGDDLLDAGVAIIARPPGKRPSHLSLLSGGEKALTAASLVFAIFQLNPAPFCLLDEVDAPLDEANVGRFCAMVGEMSEKVQFMIVTHNKATMESTRQLAGVTMREPGVSRLVSVDLAEATRMVGG